MNSTLKSNWAPCATSVMVPGGMCGPARYQYNGSRTADNTTQMAISRHQWWVPSEPSLVSVVVGGASGPGVSVALTQPPS